MAFISILVQQRNRRTRRRLPDLIMRRGENMINLKKSVCVLVSVLMAFGLTACRPEEPNATAGVKAAVEQNTLESVSAEQLSQKTPAHISKSYGENFSVEADVHVPKVEKADILFAKLMSYDEQKAVSIFYNGKTPQKTENSASDAVAYSDGDSKLTFALGDLNYRTQAHAYYKLPNDSLRANHDVNSSNPKIGEVYKQENLSFMPKAKALESVSAVLKELSLDVTGDVESYAVDSATLQVQQDKKIQEEVDYLKSRGKTPTHDKSTSDPTLGYETKDTFTPDDDFYWLFFTTKQNGIPVTQKDYNVQANERGMNGAFVEVQFSKSGIMELWCSSVYQQQSVAESPNAFLPVEKALQNAFDIENAVISSDKIKVTAIDFEYVPVPYNDNYEDVKLIPAWSLTLSDESTMPSKDGKGGTETSVYTRMLFINAVTGERIK